MSITIKDIAKIANVSHTTVSRALNDSSLINDKTKKRIKKIAEELNYAPNYNAKSLVLDKSYNIGLFFSSLDKGTSPSFFHDVVRGINKIIKGQYNLIINGIDDYQNLNQINKKKFDGIIIMSQSKNDDFFISHAIQKQIPLVVLNREIQQNQQALINILSDDKEGTYNAVNYLIQVGHRRIALIEGKEGFKSTQERKEGFLQAIKNHNIPLYKEYIVKGNYDLESGYIAMRKILENKVLPTAVFCSNDDMAVGAMKAIGEKKLMIPDDISIVGFDDHVFSSYLLPALTTVRRPIELISEEGGKRLIKLINQEKVEKQRVYIHTKFVVRDSVKHL